MPRKQKKRAKYTNEYGTELEVVVLAESDGYAMVRVKGCRPFVVNVKKQLTFIEK